MSLTHATWVSSGPLVLTAVGLMIVNFHTLDGAPAFQFTLFHVLLTYAAILALVAVSPFVIVVTRLVADCIYAERDTGIQALFIGALAFAALSAGVIGAGVWGSLRIFSWNVTISAWALSESVALLWVVTIFCGTLRDYVGVTGAFIAGIVLSAAVATVLARFDFDASAMMWTMVLANTATLTWLAARVLSAYPHPPPANAFAGVGEIGRGLRRFPLLAIGGVAGAAGAWIDKLVVWNSDIGTAVVTGLVYAPIYDSAMFISFLVIVPALAAFVVHVETELFVELGRFLSRVLNDGTLEEIEVAADRLGTTTRSSMFHLFLVQAAFAACAILALPSIVQVLGVPYRQIPIMRLGLIGSVFHLLFLLCSSVLLFINRQRSYCLLQILFLALNGLLTWMFLWLGSSYLGMGYLAAAVVSGVAAFLWMDRTLRDFVYLTFAGAVRR